ncbi:MAG: spore maturation protein A, partial [Clostridia bacterium]|nr:spore maturation protein A [Clostridia bacterium]
PILCKLFKGLNKKSDALLPISLNITSNLLGLSNAATPIGIEAMKKLAKQNAGKSTPNNNMVFFVVMNSAALRLIPTTVASIRENHGSKNPLEIVVPSLITSICALTVGITMAKILERYFKYE